MTKHGWSGALAVLAGLSGCAEVEVGAEMIKVISQKVSDGIGDEGSEADPPVRAEPRTPPHCSPASGPRVGPPPKPVPSDLDPCARAASR